MPRRTRHRPAPPIVAAASFDLKEQEEPRRSNGAGKVQSVAYGKCCRCYSVYLRSIAQELLIAFRNKIFVVLVSHHI
jgi:hypothetical protein